MNVNWFCGANTLVCFSFLTLSSFSIAQVPVIEHQNQEALLQSENPPLAKNKQLVYDFYLKVFQTRNMALAADYLSEGYIQHNPLVPTGRKAFIDFFGQFERLSEMGKVENLVSIVAERDMVVVAFKKELPDPKNSSKNYTTTWFDMFRIEDGKIAEHWDAQTK